MNSKNSLVTETKEMITNLDNLSKKLDAAESLINGTKERLENGRPGQPRTD